jgi:hypothetical protein
VHKVEQAVLAVFDARGDVVQRGDCLTACVASLFELPLSEVPFFVESESWWSDYQRFFHERGFQLGQVSICTDENDRRVLTGYPLDGVYWIATVKSPRGKARCSSCKGVGWGCGACNGLGLVPSLHCVVMRGKELVWDPHPQRAMGHLGFVQGEWFIALDPARLAPRLSVPPRFCEKCGASNFEWRDRRGCSVCFEPEDG